MKSNKLMSTCALLLAIALPAGAALAAEPTVVSGTATIIDTTRVTSPVSQPPGTTIVHPREAARYQHLLSLVSHENDSIAQLNTYLAAHAGGGGGTGVIMLPAIKVTPIGSVTGVDANSIAVLAATLKADATQVQDLRDAIANNDLANSALTSAKVDLDSVVAIDVLSTGQLEVYVR